MENPNQPREYDAVVGSQNLTPAGSMILGGIEGVKRRLLSEVEQQRIAALKDAPKYGEAGLDLMIQALQDESQQVEGAAYRLLRERAEPRVKQILQKHNPWRLFESLHKFSRDLGWVYSLAISPDVQALVSWSADATIKVWNLHTGALIGIREACLNYFPSNCVKSLAISSDGQTLVIMDRDETFIFWSLHTGALFRPLELPSWALASGITDKTIKVWNLYTGASITTSAMYTCSVYSLAIRPDGQTLFSGSQDRTIKVWDLHTGVLIRTLEGHSDSVN